MFAFDLLGTPKIAFDSGHVGVAMDAARHLRVGSSMVRTRAAGTWRPGRIQAAGVRTKAKASRDGIFSPSKTIAATDSRRAAARLPRLPLCTRCPQNLPYNVAL